MNASSPFAGPEAAPSRTLLWVTVAFALVSVAIIPLNFWVLVNDTGRGVPVAFWVLAMLQFLTGMVAAVCGFVHAVRRRTTAGGTWAGILLGVLGVLAGLGGPVGMFLVFALEAIGTGMGGAWGRPLRVRGKILHPSLCVGSDWTRGDLPDVRDLDAATRAALEALWLHDAQKEHASVPAFARIAWMLCAVGAPADLVDWSNRAAAEEIDHARRCFALAAGYGGRSHAAEPMPDLLVGGLELRGDPLAHLAIESLKDGCLLEDFNADVAGECARACRDGAAKDVLERIAREERSHAELSWALVAWLLERGGAKVERAVRGATRDLDAVARPTAVSSDKRAIVAAADRAKMRAHGRIDDAEWAAMWSARLAATKARASALVDQRLHGSSTTNVAPSPGTLSARIVPPCASTMRRAM